MLKVLLGEEVAGRERVLVRRHRADVPRSCCDLLAVLEETSDKDVATGLAAGLRQWVTGLLSQGTCRPTSVARVA